MNFPAVIPDLLCVHNESFNIMLVYCACYPMIVPSVLWFYFLYRILATLGGRNSPKTWRLTSARWPWWSLTGRLSSGWSWPVVASLTTLFWPGSFSHSTSCVRSSFRSRCEILKVPMYLGLLKIFILFWRGCGEKGSFLHCLWECKLVQPLWETVGRFLRKLKLELLCDPTIPLLGIYP